jgi:hypothetical protein
LPKNYENGSVSGPSWAAEHRHPDAPFRTNDRLRYWTSHDSRLSQAFPTHGWPMLNLLFKSLSQRWTFSPSNGIIARLWSIRNLAGIDRTVVIRTYGSVYARSTNLQVQSRGQGFAPNKGRVPAGPPDHRVRKSRSYLSSVTVLPQIWCVFF